MFNSITDGGKPFVELGDPTSLIFVHPNVSDWVILKALKLKHYIGISCKYFEDRFLVLLTTIKAQNNSASFSLKKKEHELKKLYRAINDDNGERSSNWVCSKGRGKSIVL